jgi:hypothetical protein
MRYIRATDSMGWGRARTSNCLFREVACEGMEKEERGSLRFVGVL